MLDPSAKAKGRKTDHIVVGVEHVVPIQRSDIRVIGARRQASEDLSNLWRVP